jgi:eukaryotic-like serine/threonine-protein kinase
MSRIIGRYLLFDRIASGGMATIHLGCLIGPLGFSRTVAIKELHADQATDANIRAMFLDEARLASRISHPNVVPVLDVVEEESDRLLLVMEYVHGVSLARLIALANKSGGIPTNIAVAIMLDALRGLHAAHEIKTESGELIEIVHRDISPHNILVGVDGAARVTDFGIAKARDRLQHTVGTELKGKAAYMAPEQLSGGTIDRRLDVWAAGVTLWESLTGRSLFGGDSVALSFSRVLESKIPKPSDIKPALRPLDTCVMHAITRDINQRTQTAEAFASELRRVAVPASANEVSEFVKKTAQDTLGGFAEKLKAMEVEALRLKKERPASAPALASVHYPDQIATGMVLARTALPSQAPGPTEISSPSIGGTTARTREAPAKPTSFLFGALLAAATLISAVGIAGIIYLRLAREPKRAEQQLAWADAGSTHAGLTDAASADAGWADAAPNRAPEPDRTQVVAPPETTPATKETAPTGSDPKQEPEGPKRPPKPGQAGGGQKRPPAQPPPTTSKPSKPNCDPPYTLGPPPDFIKRPKLECLGQ